ncbi:MAG: hypothetical protein LUH40_02725 [Clostridiales bacterium]|nr:hypothetical protein [Clostridiales bacterium]
MENTLNALTADRQDRMKKMLLKLKDLGISIDESDVMEFAGGESVGRPHIAQAMVKKGYVSTILEAFQKYLAFGMPAYVKRKKLTAYEIINLIKENGGQSFVAHLHQTGKTTDELYEIISDLKAHGLDGIEGYHTEYTAEMGMDYRKLADDLGLIISGGSDFHGNNKVNVNLGTGRGNMKIPYSVLENIKKHRLY